MQSTVPLRHSSSITSALSFFFTDSANLISRSVASGRRLSSTSSTSSSRSFGISAYTSNSPALTMPMSNPALKVVGLATLVGGHHDDRRAVTADEPGLVQKFLLAFLKADRVDDAFALQAFQARFDDFPFRGIHHHRHPGDVRFGGDKVDKTGHCG